MAGLNQFKELVVKFLTTVCVLTTCKRLEGLGSALVSPVVVTKKKKLSEVFQAQTFGTY